MREREKGGEFTASSSTPHTHPHLVDNSALNSLPATYDNATYQSFINQWGTHYMTNGHFGGMALCTSCCCCCCIWLVRQQLSYKCCVAH